MSWWDRPWLFCVYRPYTGAVPGLVFDHFVCVSKLDVLAFVVACVVVAVLFVSFVRRR
jgi:hypothetical protein